MTLPGFPPRPFVLHTTLTPDECAQQLQARVVGPFAVLARGRPLRGRVNAEGFDVRVMRYRRSWSFHAHGTFTRDGSGTRIEGVYEMATYEAVLLLLVAFGLVAWTVATFAGAIESPDPSARWVPLFGVAGMVVGLVSGRFTYPRDRQTILRVIGETLAARHDFVPEPIG